MDVYEEGAGSCEGLEKRREGKGDVSVGDQKCPIAAQRWRGWGVEEEVRAK